ncbi:MAG: hypothetical protein ACXABY_11745 [Candidatus Thorarchaeota archaeon]|jgi:hypothetical protein
MNRSQVESFVGQKVAVRSSAFTRSVQPPAYLVGEAHGAFWFIFEHPNNPAVPMRQMSEPEDISTISSTSAKMAFSYNEAYLFSCGFGGSNAKLHSGGTAGSVPPAGAQTAQPQTKDYPHRCPYCACPAYVGIGQPDCSNSNCPGA